MLVTFIFYSIIRHIFMHYVISHIINCSTYYGKFSDISTDK